MTDNTARLGMPFIIASQAQKEVTHNMALNMLDIFVQPVIETMGLTEPPAEAEEGQAWIVGTGATGDWAGEDDKVALRVGSAWIFYEAFDGMRFWVRDTDMFTLFRAGMWQSGIVNGAQVSVNGQQVLGERAAAINDASAGQVIDAEARLAINALLGACRNHGLIES
ncbi:DUF2793 domain-containing protein [Emcibacter sp.]|uniref:DUF2793 domain-containing protein n=1 Tax=Emcibacter sp. TaxID=1979954 RepID=UPI002AA72EE8|nr:DUF2793 domain-containing protein [Emcibacter sp.]